MNEMRTYPQRITRGSFIHHEQAVTFSVHCDTPSIFIIQLTDNRSNATDVSIMHL